MPAAPHVERPGHALDLLTEPGAFVRAHRLRVLQIGVALSALLTLLYGVFYAVSGTPAFLVANAVASAALVVIGLARSIELTARLYAAVTVGLLLFGVQLALVADVNNGITPWLIVPAIAAVIIGERNLAVYATAIAFLEPGLVVAARLTGVLSPVAELPFPNLLMLISIIAIVGISSAFAYVSSTTRARLQDEVDSRSVALAAALEEAQRANEEALAASAAKDRFFANLTHEIRTPLTGIAGSAELLARADLPGEERELADALLGSARSLTTLVNAMLDHARLAAGDAHSERGPVDLRAVGRDLQALFGRPALERGLRLEVSVGEEVPAYVETDGMHVRRVLDNLVSNALKFTAQGGVRVTIDWRPGADPAAGTVEAAVADTGPGIAAEQRESVFEPFVQGDASIRRAHGGTGLGLAIARQLAGLLGGTLELESELGAGSTFTLRIPARATGLQAAAREAGDSPGAVPVASSALAAVAPQPAPRAADAASPIAGLRVLLAEDNEVNRKVAAAMLRRSGVDVVEAVDGSAAIELAASTIVDVVLMDLQMPVLDGIEASRQIRAAEAARRGPRVPIIAMTGNAPEDYRAACVAAGMDDFVMKPMTMAELRQVLVQTVSRD